MEDGSDGVDRLIAEQTAGGLNVQALQLALIACIYCHIVGHSDGDEHSVGCRQWQYSKRLAD